MLVGETFAEVYQKLAQELMERGQQVAPRGMATKELMQETFCITKPHMNLSYIPGRGFSIMHAIAESLLLVAKENNVKCYELMNPRMKKFSDDGLTLHGAYGYRISGSMMDCLSRLANDKDTRQAILTIHKITDLSSSSKDIPCTIALQFTIRDGKLNMHVYMRSNDIVWGTPYDVFVFTNLQMVFANSLRIPVGNYYHTATSLHAYLEQNETLELIAKEVGVPIGHHNKNYIDDWRCIASVFAGIAKEEEKKWINTFALRILDKDGCYAFAIIMELIYKGLFKDNTEEAKQYFEKGKNSINEKEYYWLSNFSRRWCS